MFQIGIMANSPKASRFAQHDLSRLYLDFDSFFASAEQHFNSDLRGKPLGVVPLDAPHTGCIAVSREAKKLGVPRMASIKVAREFAPDMIFVVARPDAYVRLHSRIIKTIERCLPIAAVRSIDELVCHLKPSEARHPIELGDTIKRALAQDFSAGLTCSIGISQTELLAKIGAEMNKPDGLVVLRPDDLPAKIAHLELCDIPGISKGIAARLERAGIRTVPALWDIAPKNARALWGSIEGERFWNGLHGLPCERPPTQKRMFGHSRVLPAGWRTPEKVQECARQLTLSAARRLRRSGKRTRKITLSVRGGRHGRTSNRPSWSAEASLVASRDDFTILSALSVLLQRYRQEIDFRPGSVSITLHGLCDQDEAQGDLFSDRSFQACELDVRRRERLSDTLDVIRGRYGASAASVGPLPAIPGGYLGAKIAFGRIPDAADFSEKQSADYETQFCRAALADAPQD